MRSFALSGLLLSLFAAAQVPVDVMPEDAGPIHLLTPGTYPLHITVRNLDIDYAIDSLQAHWQLDGGAVHSCTVQQFLMYDLLYPTFHDLFTHADPVVLPTAGTHSLKLWTGMPGGFPDTDPSNDTLLATIRVVDALPPQHVVMFYGTHVTCFPCGTYGEPAVEAVLDSFPGTVHLVTAFDHDPDPYETPEGEAFNELYIWPYTGHPAFVCDVFQLPFFWDVTTHLWGELYRNPQWRMAYRSPVEVTVEALSFDSTTRVLSGEVHAAFWDEYAGALAMNAIITEDSVWGPQYGVPGGYVHHRHVLRSMSAGVVGDDGVIPAVVSAGQQFVYTFSDTLSPDVVPANVYVTGTVQRANADPLLREILNSGEARLSDIGPSTMSEAAQTTFSVFPNPAHEGLFVQMSEAGTFTLCDPGGRAVRQGTLRVGRTALQLRGLAEGLYVLHVRTDAGALYTRRIAVQP